VTSKKNFNPADRRVERCRRGAVIDQVELVPPQIFHGGGIGRAPEVLREVAHGAHVVLWVLSPNLRIRMSSSMRWRSGDTAGVDVSMVLLLSEKRRIASSPTSHLPYLGTPNSSDRLRRFDTTYRASGLVLEPAADVDGGFDLLTQQT
jgi:hypothetical protein